MENIFESSLLNRSVCVVLVSEVVALDYLAVRRSAGVPGRHGRSRRRRRSAGAQDSDAWMRQRVAAVLILCLQPPCIRYVQKRRGRRCTEQQQKRWRPARGALRDAAEIWWAVNMDSLLLSLHRYAGDTRLSFSGSLFFFFTFCGGWQTTCWCVTPISWYEVWPGVLKCTHSNYKEETFLTYPFKKKYI